MYSLAEVASYLSEDESEAVPKPSIIDQIIASKTRARQARLDETRARARVSMSPNDDLLDSSSTANGAPPTKSNGADDDGELEYASDPPMEPDAPEGGKISFCDADSVLTKSTVANKRRQL